MQRGERGGSTGLTKDKNEKTVEEGEFLTALVRGVLCFIVAQGGNHDCGPVVYVRELLSLCRVNKASYAWPTTFHMWRWWQSVVFWVSHFILTGLM